MTVLLLYDFRKKSKKDTIFWVSRKKINIGNVIIIFAVRSLVKIAGHSLKVNKLEYMLKNSMNIKVF